LTAPEALSNHGAYGRADDRAGREIRKPMDGHGDADGEYADYVEFVIMWSSAARALVLLGNGG